MDRQAKNSERARWVARKVANGDLLEEKRMGMHMQEQRRLDREAAELAELRKAADAQWQPVHLWGARQAEAHNPGTVWT